jgi:hypothetical protein
MACENVQLFTPPDWDPRLNYAAADKVAYISAANPFPPTYWQAATNCTSADVPGSSTNWMRDRFDEEMAANSHEVRLTFLWPLLPDSQPPGYAHYGTGRWTYRASVAGQMFYTNYTLARKTWNLYFFQPQNFATNAP